jgi:hypothetical protein
MKKPSNASGMKLLRILYPSMLAGTFYLLGAWGAMRGLVGTSSGGESLRTLDSFENEAVAAASIWEAAQVFRLEYLESSGQHMELRSLYEMNYLQKLRDSGEVDDATSRQRYHDRSGPPPEFNVDYWIAAYRDAIARFPLLEVTRILEVDLLSILRRHGRDTEFSALYLEILQRGGSHPAIARQARAVLSISTDPDETEILLAWIRHLARFESDERRARQLDMALGEWNARASASPWTGTKNLEPPANGWCGVETTEPDGLLGGPRTTHSDCREAWGGEGSEKLPN